ncbi:hypothetical protein LT350_09590 [Mycolicibacterium smegmatis]|uniref:hypothetical protein n=1 Tax=Mycolicibacterium smegmatis TaxID=1772 RepID=UPI001E5B41FA|nr:hypothetical protein [Mycolicibacterium smegmatis]UGU33147.1 hypothetical protein LT350_09590 [Mycolicibacterium smegmatis]ULN68024.1 hypothetical protein KZ782_20205 [Mycolicibacterium smegmatis]
MDRPVAIALWLTAVTTVFLAGLWTLTAYGSTHKLPVTPSSSYSVTIPPWFTTTGR